MKVTIHRGTRIEAGQSAVSVDGIWLHRYSVYTELVGNRLFHILVDEEQPGTSYGNGTRIGASYALKDIRAMMVDHLTPART